MRAVGVITQARTTSTRLPGKVLLEASGRTVLDHHIRRARNAGFPVIIATTTNSTDDQIVAEAERLGALVFRGSEHDVLSRFAGAVREFSLETVVRITSDCPLIDGHLIRTGVDEFSALGDPNAFVSNTLERSYPRGFDFEVFSAAALLEADRNTHVQFEREHVTPHLYRDAPAERLHQITRTPDASAYRLTLDTADDWTVIARLITEFDAADLDVNQIIGVLDANPVLTQINAHVEQKKLGE